MAYSYVQYVGNGSTKTYSVTFPYLSTAHVEVRVNNVLKTQGVDYTWTTSSTIQFGTAPATGLTVDVRRKSSPSTRLVDFQDGSTLTQDVLDTDSNQNFYLSQESLDAVDQRLPLDTDGTWNANSRRIKNVTDPVNAQDVATKNWAENSATSFIVAAQSQANSATASASAAANSATSAAGSATSATSSANSASTSANTATTKASEASTSASNAATSATNAATSATNAAASATTASGYLSTVQTNATNAATSATAASNSASNAAASASAAASSATNANSSAVNAASSESNANASKLAAAGSATSASNSASSAATSATTATTAKNDALAIYGSISAVNAAVTSAQTSATNSATSAGQAATSATNAANSATAAANSATSAASSSVSAATSATNAAALYGSASALNTAVNSAQNSATNAGTSAAQASGYVSTVATSATNAANSATQAAASAASAAAIVTGVASNRPSIRPSLLLDFSNTKQLDPRITFSRPTTATYYDGKTVVKAEENLVTYSDQFDNAAWTKTSIAVTANSTTAPDGTGTADTLTDVAGANAHGLYYGSAVAINGTVTASIYMKQSAGQYGCLLTWSTSTYVGIIVDLSAGTITSTSGMVDSSSVTSVGNGWYRLTITKTGSSVGGLFAGISDSATPTLNTGRPYWTGTGSLSVYAWGAQVEARSVVTAYTPTTTAPITNYIPALQTAVSNDARFDHDPVTGESKGLLIEEQRTNLQTYSDDFTKWGVYQASVASNVNIAPDGTLNADKFVESSANGMHEIDNGLIGGISVTSGTAYTFSLYVKAAGRNYVQFTWNSTGFGTSFAFFNVATGAVNSSTNTSASVSSVGNGWYRCSITTTAVATGSYGKVYIDTSLTGSSSSYQGDGYSGLYIWGAQLEAGSFPTSYIPTVASQVTRSADSASMTGSNFSSWYRADEGTLYGEANESGCAAGSNALLFSINDGSYAANSVSIGTYSATTTPTPYGTVRFQNTQPVAIAGAVASYGAALKYSFGYKLNDFAASYQGASVGTDTSGSIPIVTSATIGNGATGATGQVFNGTIKRIAYYPKRLSNTELQGLTS